MNKRILALAVFYLLACKGKDNSAPDQKVDNNLPPKEEPSKEIPPTDIVSKKGMTLSANGAEDTYALINKVLGGTGDVIEVPDVSHPGFGNTLHKFLIKI